MRFDSLNAWLEWQESLSPKSVELGLDRIRQVAEPLDLLHTKCPVITVAGTNGKGSVVAMISSILRCAGYRVGTYTSPHLVHYNERVCVNNQPVTDELLCHAFEAIDVARGNVRLTYFEFGTLAALWSFAEADVDVMVLEVGLGGRLDAVNIVDPDVSIITSIALDHTNWLGNTREQIAAEKSGIQRADRPLICGDRNPPKTLLKSAREAGSDLFLIGRDFDVTIQKQGLIWCYDEHKEYLPELGLHGEFQANNAACACMALKCMEYHLPITVQARFEGLTRVYLPGRFERHIEDGCTIIYDVAHNPAAARALAQQLYKECDSGRNLAVFSALSDKDIRGIVVAMDPMVDHWYVAGLMEPRGLSTDELMSRMGKVKGGIDACETIGDAYRMAYSAASDFDRIVIFGSFITVATVKSQGV